MALRFGVFGATSEAKKSAHIVSSFTTLRHPPADVKGHIHAPYTTSKAFQFILGSFPLFPP